MENLPSGNGRTLVIDNQGYLKIESQPVEATQDETEQLRQEIENLKAELASLKESLSNIASFSTDVQAKATLFQNVPNPFHQSTEIRYFLAADIQQATLFIYDWQGRPIKNIQITQRGEASVLLQAGSLRAGIYHYVLIADGQKTEVKEMVITN